ncbi:hypothetical protein Ancab_011764 [Ancistrocladus abbreviatus]
MRPKMAEPPTVVGGGSGSDMKEAKLLKAALAIGGIMSILVIYGLLQASKKTLDPVAAVYKYCLVSITNILTTTFQYEALKYVSFPVQMLAKCAKMIPVMYRSKLKLKESENCLKFTVSQAAPVIVAL